MLAAHVHFVDTGLELCVVPRAPLHTPIFLAVGPPGFQVRKVDDSVGLLPQSGDGRSPRGAGVPQEDRGRGPLKSAPLYARPAGTWWVTKISVRKSV